MEIFSEVPIGVTKKLRSLAKDFSADAGVDVNCIDRDCKTLLQICSGEGYLEKDNLISHGTQIEEVDTTELIPLHLASKNDHHRILESGRTAEVSKSSGKDESSCVVKEEGTGHFTPSNGLNIISEKQPSYTMDLAPINGLRDISTSSANVMQQQSSGDSVKIIKEETLIRLDGYNVQVRIPPSDDSRVKDITVEALTNIPPDLALKEDEVVISVGLKLSPPGLHFKSPVEVTVLHSAMYTDPEKADILLYTRRTSSDEFSRIVSSTDKLPRCIVRERDLTLYIDHFSEWWIISILRRYFVGKRLICTPYVPMSISRDVCDCLYLHIIEDFGWYREDDTPGYKKASPSDQFFLRWRYGSLRISCLVDEKEVSSQILEELEFYYLNSHRIYFGLSPPDIGLAGTLVTFILQQIITKHITFPVRNTDVGFESRSTQTGPASSTSSSDSDESFYDARRISDREAELSEEVFAGMMKKWNVGNLTSPGLSDGISESADAEEQLQSIQNTFADGCVAVKSFDSLGGIMSTESHGFTLDIPPGALDETALVEIKLEVLTDLPRGFKLQDDECLVSHGFQCYPSGLHFKKPATLTIPHCAVLTDPEKMKTVFYSWDHEKQGSPERILEPINKCRVRQHCLEISVVHFSGGYFAMILDLIYPTTIRLSCMPFLPKAMPRTRRPMLEVRLVKKPHGQDWREVHRFLERDNHQPAKDDDDVILFKGRTTCLTITCQVEHVLQAPETVEYEYICSEPKATKYFPLDLTDKSDESLVILNMTQTESQEIKFNTRFSGQEGPPDVPEPGRELVSDQKLDTLARHVPREKYEMLSDKLGISFNEANSILTTNSNNNIRSIRQCLSIWKNRTGGSLTELKEILQRSDLGGLIIHIE